MRIVRTGFAVIWTAALALTFAPLALLFLAEAAHAATIAGETIDLGGLLGQLILTIVTLFGAPIAWYLVKLVARLAHQAGFDLDEARRARLQEMVENGLREAATRTGTALGGKLEIGTRQMLVTEAAAYLAKHGAETLAKLNGDPESMGQMEELVRAWGGKLLGAQDNPWRLGGKTYDFVIGDTSAAKAAAGA